MLCSVRCAQSAARRAPGTIRSISAARGHREVTVDLADDGRRRRARFDGRRDHGRGGPRDPGVEYPGVEYPGAHDASVEATANPPTRIRVAAPTWGRRAGSIVLAVGLAGLERGVGRLSPAGCFGGRRHRRARSGPGRPRGRSRGRGRSRRGCRRRNIDDLGSQRRRRALLDVVDELELARAVVVAGQPEEAHIGAERHDEGERRHADGSGGGKSLASLHEGIPVGGEG